MYTGAMKIFIASVFSLLLIFSNSYAFAESLPPKGHYNVKAEDYPILHKYLDSYANQLFDAFTPGRLWDYHMGSIGVYHINKDGSITRLNKAENRYDEVLVKLVLDNPPLPFPKELEADKIAVYLVILRGKYEEMEVDYGAYLQTADITLTKDNKKKTKNSLNKIRNNS